MALDDLGLEIDFPTLLVGAYWQEQHCVVPDGFRKGEPWEFVKWQALVNLNFYRVKPGAKLGQLAPAFHNRRAQVVLSQKSGKAPFSSGGICQEGVGPALFAGWAKGGEKWDCREHGCGCGWVYEYQPGEAMGMPWPTPLIQVTATSEDQAANIWDALVPMIREGPLSQVITKTGEEFIRLPGDGRIDMVTSNARSRLGQRVTHCAQDETGVWTEQARMVKVAETQRRGLAGMGGRAIETTNAWDPNEGSVAERTAAAALTQDDIYRYHPMAPKGLSYTVKKDRRKIHRLVYEGCDWIDLDAIEGEAAELITVDPGQAERFYGNRPVAGSGAAFDYAQVEACIKPKVVASDAVVVLGIDGALYDDSLAIMACEVKTGYLWTVDVVEKPLDADDDYMHDKDRVDGAVRDVFERYPRVWRAYVDPHWLDSLLVGWQNSYGDKRVLPWLTNRKTPIAHAIREFEEAIGSKELTHDGNPVFMEHMSNAKRRPNGVLDDKQREMHTLTKDGVRSPRKMDAAMAGVLAWKARNDCISVGGVSFATEQPPDVPVEPPKFGMNFAPPASSLVGAPGYSPNGNMS